MFGIQGGYLGNTAGLVATSPGMIAGSPSFEINEGAKTRKMRGIRNRQEQGAPGEREAAEELMRRLGGPQLPMANMVGIPGAVGNMGGMMAQLPDGEQGPAQGTNTPIQFGGPQLPMANMGGMPGAVGNMGEIQAFEDALTLPQNIRGSKYRYEQETVPSFFHNKRVY